jgi:Ca2+-binding RTX toxin-like protein
VTGLTNGKDVYYGTDRQDHVRGLAGNDTIYGRGGEDYLQGDAGNDWIYGGPGADHLNGGEGNDTLVDWEGGAEIYGGNGNDTIITVKTDDYSSLISGGAGSDTITMGEGSEVWGGKGVDHYTAARFSTLFFHQGDTPTREVIDNFVLDDHIFLYDAGAGAGSSVTHEADGTHLDYGNVVLLFANYFGDIQTETSE